MGDELTAILPGNHVNDIMIDWVFFTINNSIYMLHVQYIIIMIQFYNKIIYIV